MVDLTCLLKYGCNFIRHLPVSLPVYKAGTSGNRSFFSGFSCVGGADRSRVVSLPLIKGTSIGLKLDYDPFQLDIKGTSTTFFLF